jgi:hypothetical protein
MTPTLAPLVIEEADYDTDRGMQCVVIIDELGPQLIEMGSAGHKMTIQTTLKMTPISYSSMRSVVPRTLSWLIQSNDQKHLSKLDYNTDQGSKKSIKKRAKDSTNLYSNAFTSKVQRAKVARDIPSTRLEYEPSQQSFKGLEKHVKESAVRYANMKTNSPRFATYKKSGTQLGPGSYDLERASSGNILSPYICLNNMQNIGLACLTSSYETSLSTDTHPQKWQSIQSWQKFLW